MLCMSVCVCVCVSELVSEKWWYQAKKWIYGDAGFHDLVHQEWCMNEVEQGNKLKVNYRLAQRV